MCFNSYFFRQFVCYFGFVDISAERKFNLKSPSCCFPLLHLSGKHVALKLLANWPCNSDSIHLNYTQLTHESVLTRCLLRFFSRPSTTSHSTLHHTYALYMSHGHHLFFFFHVLLSGWICFDVWFGLRFCRWINCIWPKPYTSSG